MSVAVEKYSTLEQEGYVKVVCRLCGEEWLYPPQYANEFDSEHGLECSYCKGRMKRMRKLNLSSLYGSFGGG